MKIVLSIVLVLLALLIARFVQLSMTEKVVVGELIRGKLRSCPDTPNCVCSEQGGTVAPIAIRQGEGGDADAFDWSPVESAIKSMGGEIKARESGYLHATFRSRLFRFTDDLELRLDGDVLQVRSASRSGHSDLGVNNKRVEALRDRLKI